MIDLDGYYLLVFIGYAALAMAGAAWALVWAWRSGQFKNQDRARYLVLEAAIPQEGRAEAETEDGHAAL